MLVLLMVHTGGLASNGMMVTASFLKMAVGSTRLEKCILEYTKIAKMFFM
jgi:hypothetical protein